jgi:hypothetical protein
VRYCIVRRFVERCCPICHWRAHYTGFADAAPDYLDVKVGNGGSEILRAIGPALVVWGYAFGRCAGDEIALKITGPRGEVFAHTVEIEKNTPSFFARGGKKTPTGGWSTGIYDDTIAFIRDGVVLDTARTRMTLTP